jgi:hypothetical protein
LHENADISVDQIQQYTSKKTHKATERYVRKNDGTMLGIAHVLHTGN